MQYASRTIYPGLLFALLALPPSTHAATQPIDPAVETVSETVIEKSQELIVPVVDEAGGDFGGLLGSWTLVALDGAMPETDRGAPTLEVMPDGTVAGLGGVNRYRARLKNDLPAERVKITLGASTMMAGPEASMATEHTFLQRLEAVSSFNIIGDTLHMDAGDNEALTFVRATGP